MNTCRGVIVAESLVNPAVLDDLPVVARELDTLAMVEILQYSTAAV